MFVQKFVQRYEFLCTRALYAALKKKNLLGGLRDCHFLIIFAQIFAYMIDATILLSITDYLDAKTLFELFVDNASYWFVFMFMVIESSFIPFPSEVVVPPAAYLAVTRGDMNIFLVVVFATLGAMVGATVNYWLSVWVGRPIVYSFADSKLGHLCLIDRAKVDKAEAYFDKHGNISTFIGRLIPAVRQLISIPAGLARMKLTTFLFYTTLGAGVWNSLLATAGWYLQKHVSEEELMGHVMRYSTELKFVFIGLGICVIAYLIYKGMQKPDGNRQAR